MISMETLTETERVRENQEAQRYKLYIQEWQLQHHHTKWLQSWLYTNQISATALYAIYKNSLT